ncbi:unnamed protein product, partial [Mesorhabditis spiculigera]
MNENESPSELDYPIPLERPVPKPRKKLPPRTSDDSDSSTSTLIAPTPPPRPPPPRPRAREAPKLFPRSPHYIPDPNKMPSPTPQLPPRPPPPAIMRPTLPSMDDPNHALPYPLTDRLPVAPNGPPEIGWFQIPTGPLEAPPPPQTSQDPMQPLPTIPQGAAFREPVPMKSAEFGSESFVPDRPALPNYFDPPQPQVITPPDPVVQQPTPSDLELLGQFSMFHTEYVDAASEIIDVVENPIYLKLSEFRPRRYCDDDTIYATIKKRPDNLPNLLYVGFGPEQIQKTMDRSPLPASPVARPNSISLQDTTRQESVESSGEKTPTPSKPPRTFAAEAAWPSKQWRESKSMSCSDEDATPIASHAFFPDNLATISAADSTTNIFGADEVEEMDYNGGMIGCSLVTVDTPLPADEELANIETAMVIDKTNDDSPESSLYFSGLADYYPLKKDKIASYVNLSGNSIVVYSHEDHTQILAGPFDLIHAEFIGCNEQTDQIICRFMREDEPNESRKSAKESRKWAKDRANMRELRFCPQGQRDDWLQKLVESWFAASFVIRGDQKLTGMLACGRVWLRRFVSGSWTSGIVLLKKNKLSYLPARAEEWIDIDIRMVVAMKENLDASEWCPRIWTKEKEREKGPGPFLVAFENHSLYIECDDGDATTLWRKTIVSALTVNQLDLEQCRLTHDSVPVHIDKCIRFIAVYGLDQEGLYRKNGRVAEAKKIRESLLQEPRDFQITKLTEETIFAVCDVMSERNKAKIENVAKIFGPTLFTVESYADRYGHGNSLNNQRPTWVCYLEQDPLYETPIGVTADMILCYSSIFPDLSGLPVNMGQIAEAEMKSRLAKQRVDGLLVPVHLWERDNRAFNVNSKLVAEEVCEEARRLHGFNAPLSGKYAVYEMIMNGALQRRLSDNEKLDDIVVNRWVQWRCSDAYLLLDHFSDQSMTPNSFSGKVKVAEPGSKSYKTVELALEEGTKVKMYKNNKLVQTWCVDSTLWFVGANPSRKFPHAHCLTCFVDLHSPISDKSGWVFSWANIIDRNHFHNAIVRAQTRGECPVLLRL